MEKHRLIPWTISTCGGNVNYKSVHQPIPTRENREHPGNFQNESVSSAFNWVLPFYFLKWNCYFSACKQKFLESTSRKFLRFSSARVKICQIPHVNFELTSQFLLKFCIILHCHDTKLPYKFEAHKFSTLDKKIPSESPFLV